MALLATIFAQLGRAFLARIKYRLKPIEFRPERSAAADLGPLYFLLFYTQNHMGKHFVGFDVGGTTVKSMMVDEAGKQVGDMVEIRSHVREGYRRTFSQIEESMRLLCEANGVSADGIAAVGLDVPAPCSKGVIWGRANLSEDWVGTDICKELAEDIGKPVTMMNDGNAAAYGEWLLREDHDSGLLLMAPGTGLGGGLVSPDGVPYEGAFGLALEVSDGTVPFDEDGRIPSDATGREGCLEASVSLVALRRQLQIALSKDEHQDHELAKSEVPIEEKALSLRDYAEQGDDLALELFQKQAHILGYGIGDLVSILDPGLVVIGGGLAESKFRDWYLDAVKYGFDNRAAPFYKQRPIPPHDATTKFDWAIGGDAAPAFGVARKAMALV
ncbi:MAG: glucokinase [Verrucomicrobiales bacterium]